jgi:hypothetical protein
MAKRIRIALSIQAWGVVNDKSVLIQETQWESADVSTPSPQLTDLIQRVSAEGLRIVLEKALTP